VVVFAGLHAPKNFKSSAAGGEQLRIFKLQYCANLLSGIGLSLTLGCSIDTIQRTIYQAVQGYSQLQCKKNPTADCPKGNDFDRYQQQKKALNAASQQ
jgi:hypothetical protein